MSKTIATALHQVMSSCGYVQKTGKNQFHGYKYAGEADLLEKLRPAMVEAGLLLIPSAKSVSEADSHGNVTVSIEYTLAHKDGDVWPEKIVAIGCGNDKAKNGNIGDKGVYKAITGANKYLLFKLFQIETGDDPENDGDQKSASQNETEPKHKKAYEVVASKAAIAMARQLVSCEALTEIEDIKQSQEFKNFWSIANDADRKHIVAAAEKRKTALLADYDKIDTLHPEDILLAG